ncbi:MAG: hypothetical protein RLZZ235_1488 [Pseudomonadota bacterium]
MRDLQKFLYGQVLVLQAHFFPCPKVVFAR